MKKLISLILLIGLISLILVSSGCTGEKPAEKSRIEAKPEPQELESIEVFGTVEAEEVVNIQLDFSAVVEAVEIKEGRKVSAGDRLAVLDISRQENKLAEIKADLEAAEHKLSHLQNTSQERIKELAAHLKLEKEIYRRDKKELAEKKGELREESSPDLQKLISKLDTEKKLCTKAEKKLMDKEKLLAKGVLPQSEVDDYSEVVTNRRQAVKDLELSLVEAKYNRRQEIEQLQDSLLNRQKVVNELELKLLEQEYRETQDYLVQKAEVEALKREVERSTNQLEAEYLQDNMIVSGLETAVVSRMNCRAGDVVTSEEELLTLIDLSSLIVEAEVPEEFIKDVKVGAEAVIIPLADSGRKYTGKVIEIADMAVERNGETVVPVNISLADRDEFLLPNFNVDVEIKK